MVTVEGGDEEFLDSIPGFTGCWEPRLHLPPVPLFLH